MSDLNLNGDLRKAIGSTHCYDHSRRDLCDCESRCATCRIVATGTTTELRDALREIVTEHGPCEHDVNICFCSEYALLRRADVALGDAHYCACRQFPPDAEREPICLRCHGEGIIYHNAR